MALYANENGTIQQLSDKSSGSNPYGQLEFVYYRDFKSNPIAQAEENYSIDVYTNKAIKDYKFILLNYGGTPGNGVATNNPYWIRIDLWMECYQSSYYGYNIGFSANVGPNKTIFIRCKNTKKGTLNMAAFDDNILELEINAFGYDEGYLGIFMI